MKLYKDTYVKTDHGTMPISLVQEGYKVMCFDGNYRKILFIDIVQDDYIFDITLSDGETVHLGAGSNILMRTPGDIKNGISNEPNKIIEVNENTLKHYKFICYRDSWDSTIRNTSIEFQHNYLLAPDDFYKITLDTKDTDNEMNNIIEVKFKYSDKAIFVS
jgi:hypothetical protein